MSDYPIVEIGREKNADGEPLVRVGGALCGTVDSWKRLIADFEASSRRTRPYADDPDFATAVISTVKDAQRRRVL